MTQKIIGKFRVLSETTGAILRISQVEALPCPDSSGVLNVHFVVFQLVGHHQAFCLLQWFLFLRLM